MKHLYEIKSLNLNDLKGNMLKFYTYFFNILLAII